MRVVDTSAWIEWLVDSDLGRSVGPALPEFTQWIVPTIVQYELARWLNRNVSEHAADAALALSLRCHVIPLSSRASVRAAEVGRAHRLALADSIIYATAIDAGADLLTCDTHFQNLPGVVYLAKSPP
ncbi:MAG: type II toxin-antitoxin system VapC family toxin [Roseiarcus sp.]